MRPLSDRSILRWRWEIGEVTDGLFVGGDLPIDDHLAVDHLTRWVDRGVTHILDVREEWSDEDLVAHVAPHVSYTHLGVDDDGGVRDPAWFDAGAKAARRAAGAGDGLLVHCHMGINRGPSMALAVLLDRGWDPIEALDAIRAARPIAAVGYAVDAVTWHLSRTGASRRRIAAGRVAVERWHRDHDIDLERVIRRIRQAGDAA